MTAKLIPRRIVFRALADVLGGQARHFKGMKPERSLDRRTDAILSPSRDQGRELRTKRLLLQADTFTGWIGDPEHYQGAGVDAIVFAHLIALTYGHSEALGEIKHRMEELGQPDVLLGLGAEDLVAIVASILK